MNDEVLSIVMRIIADSGDSISCSMSAMQYASEGDFEQAKQELQNAEKAINVAHKAHTELLFKEANNEVITVTTLLVHASNHLTNAEVSYNFADQIIKLYAEVKKDVHS